VFIPLLKMRPLFWFRKSAAKDQLKKKDPVGSIQLRITIENSDLEIGSTSIICKKSQWDPTNQRITGSSRNKTALNLKLSQIAATITNVHHILSAKYDFVYPKLVKDYYLGHKKFTYSISEIHKAFFDHRQAQVNKGIITEGTFDVNQNYSRHILAYCVKEGINKPIQIPTTYFSDLYDFVITTDRTGDRMARKLACFAKQVIVWAKKKGMAPALPCLNEALPGKADNEEDLDTTHLSIHQILKLYHFDFHKSELRQQISEQTATTLSRERDAFVFNCSTGMHHCDYVKKGFRVEAYSNELFLHGARQKTKVKFSTKLLAPAVEILKRYNNNLEDLPIKSNQKRNDTLKLVAGHVGIPLKLTTKIARKTFCDLALNEMLMSPDDVAACLGLKSTRHLKNYGRIREKRLLKTMKSWEELKSAS